MSEDWRDETLADASSHPGDGTDPGAAPPVEAVVVVAVDFSEPARRAVAWALDYAQRVPCVLHTVHVVDRRWRPADLRADPTALQRELADAERTASDQLKVLGDEARVRVGALHEHVALGRPADELVRVAEHLGADLLVIGSHGRDALGHLLLGSVAERVVRRASCPVVVVKAR